MKSTKPGTSDRYSSSFERSVEKAHEKNLFLPAVGHTPFTIDCWYYDFDGISFGRISKSIVIPKYEGLKPVASLPVYPEKLNDSRHNLKEELALRGAKFLELCSGVKVNHRQYEGRTLDDIPEEVDSRVIVDCQMATSVQAEHRPDKSEWMPELKTFAPTEPDEREIMESSESCTLYEDCELCKNKDFFNDHSMNRQRMKEHFNPWTYLDRSSEVADLHPNHPFLFPSRVWGFVLRSRKWGMDFLLSTATALEGSLIASSTPRYRQT